MLTTKQRLVAHLAQVFSCMLRGLPQLQVCLLTALRKQLVLVLETEGMHTVLEHTEA